MPSNLRGAAGAILRTGGPIFCMSGLSRQNSNIRSFDPHLDRLTGAPKRYALLAAPGVERWAEELVHMGGASRFKYFQSSWEKFPDGTDHIVLGGYTPQNEIRGSHVVFLACFKDNDSTLTQYHALVCIAESFIESLTIVLPYFPTGTMERVLVEGEVATANTLSKMLSSLPNVGKPIRVMLYDLHTLQNRFYFGNNALATLHTAFPVMIQQIKAASEGEEINCIVYPDDGSEKRFKYLFDEDFPDMESVVCSKKRDPDDPTVRKVVIKDGSASGKRCLLVDDLVQSGGTLHECAKKLIAEGAESVSAFVTHAIFPGQSWRRFLKDGDRCIFVKFFVTDSNPHVTDQIPQDDCFTVLNLMSMVVHDI